MRKTALISLLEAIEGDPDILLWNGAVQDWMDIKRLTPILLTRPSFKYVEQLNALQSETQIVSVADKKPEVTKPFTKEDYERVYTFKYDSSYQTNLIELGLVEAKEVMLIEAALRGVTTNDRAGSVSY